MECSPEALKILIESISKHYDDSLTREFEYGNPDEPYLEHVFEALLCAGEFAVEWNREATKMGWNAVKVECSELVKRVSESIECGKHGIDPLIYGHWIIELLNRIPKDMLAQRLGITSLKEFGKTKNHSVDKQNDF